MKNGNGTRIYRVDDGAGTVTLIRAPNGAQAIRHAAKKFTARVASQDDLCELVAAGAKVQEANATEES